MEDVLKWLKEKIGWVIVLVLLVFFIASQWMKPDPLTADSEDALGAIDQISPVEEESVETPDETSQPVDDLPQEIYVDVKGAVKQPDVYQMLSHQRVSHAIDQAGGLTDHADPNQINFAMALHDQMVLYIPALGEEVADELKMMMNTQASTVQQGGGGHPADSSLININTADLNELTQLNGIGEKKAQSILSYREENGPFKSIDDLTEVSGIGDKTLDNLRDAITVGY